MSRVTSFRRNRTSKFTAPFWLRCLIRSDWQPGERKFACNDSMPPVTYSITFDGDLLRRGFWLYICEIEKPDRSLLYYVGRTGDSSSSNAQSPFNRMSQHLGFNERSNVLRRRLTARDIDLETCNFRLVAH